MSKIKQGSAAYNSPFSLDIAGVIDPNMFSNTVLELVKRHESLRTVFVQKDNEVYQRILPIDEFKLQLDICNVNSKEEVDKIIDSDIQVEFDLTTGPLLRCKLIYIDDRTILYFNIHHIIHDGWSSKVFLNDFITIFTMLYNKQPVTLEPLSIQYKDYSVWQRNMLDNGYMKEAEQYWLNVFEDKVKPIDLCIAKRRPNQRNFMGDKVTKVVSYSIMRKIKEYCNKKGITLYMYLMGAADILMYLYSGENDVVIGSPIAGRSQAVLEKQIGYYANTIAIRNYVSDNQTVAELLDVVKENTLKSFNYQDYPFGRLVREKANARISNRNPLFDVMMVLQNTNMIVNQKLMIGTMPITEINDLGTSSLFDLHIEFTENEYGIDIALDYDVDLFERQDIIGLGSDLVELLTLLMEDQTLIKDISLRNLMSNHGISNWEMDDLLDLLNGEK